MGVSQRLVTDSQAQSVAITFDGQVAAAGLPDGTVRVWAVKDGRELYKLVGHLYLVTSVVMTPDARRLVSGAGDRTLRVWDLVASQHEAAVELQAAAVVALDSEVSCVAASSEGLTIIAGDKSGAVSCFRLWDPPLW
jgi:WD40 repeat protein